MSRRLAPALAAIAALHVLIFAAVLRRTVIRTPFSDMLGWLDWYLQYRAQGGLFQYLRAFHNEHRLLWVRLLTALDASWFHASGWPFIVSATAALLIAAAPVTRELARALPAASPMFPDLGAADAIWARLRAAGLAPE